MSVFSVFVDLPVSKIAASKHEESGSLGCDVYIIGNKRSFLMLVSAVLLSFFNIKSTRSGFICCKKWQVAVAEPPPASPSPISSTRKQAALQVAVYGLCSFQLS